MRKYTAYHLLNLHIFVAWEIFRDRAGRARQVRPQGSGEASHDHDKLLVMDIVPDVPKAMSFGISIDADGINIGARGGDDYRGVKIEIQDGAIRVMRSSTQNVG